MTPAAKHRPGPVAMSTGFLFLLAYISHNIAVLP